MRSSSSPGRACFVLNGTLSLHDARDVEALCRAALKRSGRELSFHEYEDELARLIAECWRLSKRYDRERDRALEKGRVPSFASYAFEILVQRASAGERERYRTRWVSRNGVYERPAPELRSLDEAREGGAELAVCGSGFDPDHPAEGFLELLRQADSRKARHKREIVAALTERVETSRAA